MDQHDAGHLTRRAFAALSASAAASTLLPRLSAAEQAPATGTAPPPLPPVGFDARSWLVGGQPAYLLSGEFHYFRVPKADWKRRMQLFKDAGGNCLATYVPWLLHEPVEGRFEFGGERLDFEGFCETAHALGLHVVARPGPYQYSELRYDGLPGWLYEGYPALRALRLDGSAIRTGSISYVHPLFLDKARRWLDRACPLVGKHTSRRGGPVALVQFDNELAGVHVWFGSPDYNPETMGFGRADGRYPRWLEARHGSLATLSRRYGTSFASFAEVEPPAQDGAASLPETRRRRDYYDFYLSTIAEYAATLAGWMRGHGIDVPLVHNSGGPQMNAMFQETIAAVPGPFLLGSDHYYSLDQTWPQNNPTPQYALGCFYSLEMLRLMGFPPTVWELPGGSSSDWPPLTPQDAKAAYLANLAFGMKGSNYYIFTGGENPPGAGTTSDVYDYGAAISARGEVRPLYAAQKEFAAVLSRHPWLPLAEREGDLRVGLSLDDCRADGWSRGRGELTFSGTDAFDLFRRGLLNTAFCASLSPVLVDLQSDAWTADRSTPVAVVAGSSLRRSVQERLARFVAAGGRLLLLPVLPTHDENLEPCTVLADALGGARAELAPNAFNRVTVDGVANVAKRDVFFAEPPAGATVIGRDETSGRPIAWELGLPGGGQVVLVGLRWLHTNHEQSAMLQALARRLGASPRVECSNPGVWTSLRSHEGRSVVFLLNLLSAPMEATVRCRPARRGTWVDAGRHALEPMSVKVVELA
jgi:beta-galactosidase